jgi:ribosomal protein S18 acetylase RimI-like enzyme
MQRPTLVPVVSEDRDSFMEMAITYFKEATPGFEPQEDFKKYFFPGMFKPNIFCDWVVRNGKRVGFVIFGVEDHLFLPRKTGFFYAFYIVPEARKGSVAPLVMQECCRVLDTFHPSKIQLEVIEGNEEAHRIWTWMGFRRVSSKYFLLDRKF